jgi:hypothetical protein
MGNGDFGASISSSMFSLFFRILLRSTSTFFSSEASHLSRCCCCTSYVDDKGELGTDDLLSSCIQVGDEEFLYLLSSSPCRRRCCCCCCCCRCGCFSGSKYGRLGCSQPDDGCGVVLLSSKQVRTESASSAVGVTGDA